MSRLGLFARKIRISPSISAAVTKAVDSLEFGATCGSLNPKRPVLAARLAHF